MNSAFVLLERSQAKRSVDVNLSDLPDNKMRKRSYDYYVHKKSFSNVARNDKSANFFSQRIPSKKSDRTKRTVEVEVVRMAGHWWSYLHEHRIENRIINQTIIEKPNTNREIKNKQLTHLILQLRFVNRH
ncbi:predicted protein [Chaetoceros tenuissimus]|uniref:Uncharacterized protein n=1 Tax=Chaetoceros tenuissimus TaxID=426638 RepID=A0AAD3H335_9STRA|nr:predicted protein [Chaetoceros tenuissimus]